MEMTKDALQLLQETAVTAAGIKLHEIKGDPDHLLIERRSTGAFDLFNVPPKHRNHTVSDLDSLLELADRCTGKGVLWHSEEAVVLVFDDEIRRDAATLPLKFSTAYKALRDLGYGTVLTQKDFIRLLKVTLADCVPPDLLPSVRTLNFSKSESGNSDLQHGKSSLGRAVESSITGATAIPESFQVGTNVYANVLQDLTVSVRVAIDIDMEEHYFRLSVMGDDLTTTMLETQDQLSETLVGPGGSDPQAESSGRRVLFGKP